MKLVIPCAGEGKRLGTKTPKCLTQVGGRSILGHITSYWSGLVDDFVIIVNPKNKKLIEANSGDAIFVLQEEPLGLADAILQVKPYIKEREKFIVSLGDCLYQGIFNLPEGDFNIGVGAWETSNCEELLKNYLVIQEDKEIGMLLEKPEGVYCGMGVYFLDSRIFEYIEENEDLGLTEVLQLMVLNGETIVPVVFKGVYLNVTYPEDIAKAEFIFASNNVSNLPSKSSRSIR